MPIRALQRKASPNTITGYMLVNSGHKKYSERKKNPGVFLSQKRWGATSQDSRLDVHSIGIPAGKQLRLSPFYILQMAFTPKLHGILRKVLIGMHPQVVHGSGSEPDMLLGGFIALRLETDI